MATYVVGGAGVAALITGGILGGLAVGQKGTVDQHCGAGIGRKDETSCDQTGLDAASSMKADGLASTIGFVVGSAALGSALVLFLTEPKAAGPATGRRTVRVSTGISVGPGGVVMGLQGAW